MAYGYRGDFADRPMTAQANLRIAGTPPYAQVLGSSPDAALPVCYPFLYFEWVKARLRKKLSTPPTSSASATDKVVWALDVWAHVQYALFALNIPMEHVRGRGTRLGAKPPTYKVSGYKAPHGTGVPKGLNASWEGTVPHWGPGTAGPLRPVSPPQPIFERFRQAINAFYDDIAWEVGRERTRVAQAAGSPDYKRRVEDAPVMPAPFMSMVQFWTMDNHDSNLWDIVATKCLPWMERGMMLPSYGGKDAAEWASAGSAARERALMDWRLWSLRDFYPWKRRGAWVKEKNQGFSSDFIKADWMPLGMGRIDNMATLSDYIARVSRQHAEATVHYTDGALYPTLQYVIQSGLPALANLVIGTDYQQTIRQHVTQWFEANRPKIDEEGNLAKWPAGSGVGVVGQPMPIGLAQTEWADAYSRRIDLEQALNAAQAHAKTQGSPKEKCAGEDNRKLCEQVAGFVYAFKDWPYFKQMDDWLKGVQHFLIKNFDSAVGSTGYFPFFPIPQPFTRSEPSAPYATTVEGPTAEIGERVFKAVSAIELTLGLHVAPWMPKPGQPLPTPVLPPELGPLAKPFDPAICAPTLARLRAQNPTVVVTAEQQAMLQRLCQFEAAGKLPFGATLKAWAKIAQASAPPPKSNAKTVLLWSAGTVSVGAAAFAVLRRLR